MSDKSGSESAGQHDQNICNGLTFENPVGRTPGGSDDWLTK
jgi:hypothetical protein